MTHVKVVGYAVEELYRQFLYGVETGPGKTWNAWDGNAMPRLRARRIAWPHSPRSALPAARQGYGRLGHLVKVRLDYRQRTPAAELWVWALAPVPLQGCPDLGNR